MTPSQVAPVERASSATAMPDLVTRAPDARAARPRAARSVPDLETQSQVARPVGPQSARGPVATPPNAPALHATVLDWYARHARDLPWRQPDAGAWAVLVSEFMLQQTPVVRVLPVYAEWLDRWPTPAALAAEPAGEAVRAWGRLGYPRRALRLHAAAQVCVQRYGGAVPSGVADLTQLPGVGRYTAAAVASFAYGQRHAVLDTNVRRVHARAVSGRALPAPAATADEWRLAESLLPAEAEQAATWAVAVMELGAVVCTARAPRCGACPLADVCAWQRAGRPADAGPPRRGQAYHGTDRQCRGRLLAVARDSAGPVDQSALDAAWPVNEQRDRALASLLADGLLERLHSGRYQLPGAGDHAVDHVLQAVEA